jgi:lipoyl(octanoyl) transferase
MLRGDIIDLGVMPYRDAHAYQLEVVGERQRDERHDALVLVEHPHVYTLGRSRAAEANVLAPGDVEVIAIERGGDVTYHGPGQLVAYPIVKLGGGERDLHKFLRNLEESVIRTLGEFGIESGRAEGATGVWIGPRKIASIGIACRKWVTFHGLALNVNTDLAYFARVNPCGFDAAIMTSMAAESGGVAVDLDAVKKRLPVHLGAALGREFGVLVA